MLPDENADFIIEDTENEELDEYYEKEESNSDCDETDSFDSRKLIWQAKDFSIRELLFRG